MERFYCGWQPRICTGSEKRVLIPVSLSFFTTIAHPKLLSWSPSRIPLSFPIPHPVREPIIRSEELPCARHTAFSWTSLFLERFWHKFWISFKLHKPNRKTYRFKNDIFCFLITFSFSFWYLILRMPSQTRWGFYFRGKRCLEMCLKINWSIKTPWHRPSMGVARSGLWAPIPCQDFGESRFQSDIQTPST